MVSKSHERRSNALETDTRERLTELYAAINHALADRAKTDDVAALLSDDVTLIEATGDGASRTIQDVDAVVERICEGADAADHLQLLPEAFSETSDGIVVSGAYVGTADGTNFDVPFVHTYELETGTIRRWSVDTDPALDRVTDA